MAHKQLELNDDAEAVQVFGVQDRNLKRIREHFGVRITARGATIALDGEPPILDRVAALIEDIRKSVGNGGDPEELVSEAIAEYEAEQRSADNDADPNWSGANLERVARTPGQLTYLRAIAEHPIVMAIGPAGTGKTYLAVR
ncbi:MAG: PhoH family protein, partial [Planctomycetota bacterium]